MNRAPSASRRAWLRTALLGLAVCAPALASALPTSSSLEGVLMSAGGAPAADGEYDVTFALYPSETAKDPSWTEGPVKVTLKSGRFNAIVGKTKAIDATVLAAANAWLGVKVGADPELPRQALHAAPYAILAQSAATLSCSGCVSADQVANGAIPAAKVGFNYAGSTTKGGAALDLDCTGCVAVSELKFDADVDLGGNSLKAANATFSGGVAAKTVTATSFIGDGSKLTGIVTPAGTCAKAGEVVKGIKADGSLECVAALDPSALPNDGIDEISNGLLFNQFKDVIGADVKSVTIPDNTGAQAVSNLTFPDIGTAQVLTVTVHIQNTDLSTVALTLLPPDDKKVGLTLCDPCGAKDAKELKATYPVPTKTQTGDLTTWIGKNPKGLWNLKVSDTSYCVVQAPGNAALCDPTAKTDGIITDWSISIQTLSTKKVGIGGNLVLGSETAPCDSFAKGAIRYSTALAAIQVCDGSKWWPELIGDSKDNPAVSCWAIKDRAPGVKSGTYWLDPDGDGAGLPYQVYCDQETGGGGWTLVAKVKGKDAVMNRANTAQWRNKNPFTGQSCGTTKDENALCESYDKVGFSAVMIRSLAKPQRNLAWQHRDSYASVWAIINAGTRVWTHNRIFGSVDNLDYNGDPYYHRDCSGLAYGFLTADWSYNTSPGIAGHNIPHGHSGGVVGASLMDWAALSNGKSYGPSSFSAVHCLSDFALGGGYYDVKAGGDDAYAINAHFWGNGNDQTNSWNAHGVFVR